MSIGSSSNDLRILMPASPSKSLATLVTPAEAKTLPVHRWFLYPHSYSPGLVRELLAAFRLGPDTLVYDPFCGAGTTLRTAQEEGYSAFGADMLPLSVLLSNAKVTRYSVHRVDRCWKDLQERYVSLDGSSGELSSDIPLVAKAFPPGIPSILARIRAAIFGEPSLRYRLLFMVALARLIEYVSLAVKSGGWPRLVVREIDAASVYPKFVALVEAMIADITQDMASSTSGHWHCYQGDATRIPRVRSIGAVITSPPYVNRHDYTRVLALEHAVLFNMRQAELISLRHSLLRSHIEIRQRSPVQAYMVPRELAEVLPSLAKATQNDHRVYRMVTGYFEDMFLTLRALKSRLVDNGYVAFVLGDVRFSGIMLPVEGAVRRIGEQIGLQWVATWQARDRGNSAQQMKAFGREPAHEYVILWQAPRTA